MKGTRWFVLALVSIASLGCASSPEKRLEVARPRIQRDAGGYSGAWSYGASDKNLLLYIADIAHQYLVANR